jgi:hypothetical protein
MGCRTDFAYCASRTSSAPGCPPPRVELDRALATRRDRALRDPGHRPDAADHEDVERAVRGVLDAARVALARDAAGRRSPSAHAGRPAAPSRPLAELGGRVPGGVPPHLPPPGAAPAGPRAGEARPTGSGGCLRALQPVAKLLTGKQSVAHASEVLEAFGGAGLRSRTPGFRPCCATRRCYPSGKGRPTSSRWICCGRSPERRDSATWTRSCPWTLGAATDARSCRCGNAPGALMDAAGGWLGVAQQGGPAGSRAERGGSALSVGRR